VILSRRTGETPDGPRNFVLAADDYGLSPGVSRAILGLLRARRISATGSMVNAPAFREFARELLPFAERADLGLHLNLTTAAPLAAMPVLAPSGGLPALGRLARLAAISGAARAEIAAEIERQLDAFEGALGRPPDYVDGHRHAHVLPGVRGALLAAIARRYPTHRVYLRDPFDTPGAILARGVVPGKAAAIAALSVGLRRQAKRHGIATNDSFAGVSAFDPNREFGSDFRRYLLVARERHLVMCHPGEADDTALAGLDEVTATRPLETRYLTSNQFNETCDELGLAPSRFQWPES
jgi:hypothetical protein